MLPSCAALTGQDLDRSAAQNGTDFMQHFDEAGNLAYRSAEQLHHRDRADREDRLCQRFEGHFLDRETCGYVYRNPAEPAEADEAADQPPADYAHVSPHALEYFRLEDCCR